MEIKLQNGSLMVTKEVISDMLGLRNDGDNILMNEDLDNDVASHTLPSCKIICLGDSTIVQNWLEKESYKQFLLWICNTVDVTTHVDLECGSLKEREKEEIISGGLGLGEKESPFMEEDENGFPEHLEGFASKLGKYIETIGKSKTCFDKTLAIGMEVFPDSGLLKDLEANYAEVMRKTYSIAIDNAAS
ncbi:hypothetical protein Tco_1112937 [Tanacetum coccineum]|uniref:Uncharacterized protein n=1 Tax=Tanacetum coccineum TaxID=301880 RepID=A0ABQ5IR23_9ASTR